MENQKKKKKNRKKDLKKKYGYGKWVQLEHDGRGCANMTVDGKFFRAVEPNVYDAGTSCVSIEKEKKKKKKNLCWFLCNCFDVSSIIVNRGTHCRL